MCKHSNCKQGLAGALKFSGIVFGANRAASGGSTIVYTCLLRLLQEAGKGMVCTAVLIELRVILAIEKLGNY